MLFYSIPRLIFALCVRLPRTLWDIITFRRPITYSFKRERHIRVVHAPSENGKRVAERFGLNDHLYYSGPMYSGHIHTILGGARLPKRVEYERELPPAEDGNPICLDWLRTEKTPKGIVFVVPGLGNYSQTPYIQRMSEEACAMGFHICIMTVRGMGSAPLQVAKFASVTFTEDVRWTMKKYLQEANIKEKFGQALSIVAIGFSAGGSMLTKAVAEEGASGDGSVIPFRAVICVTAPYDMETHSATMLSFMGKLLYQRPLMVALRRFAQKHKNC
ncbi:hypothetical protein AGDE_08048 [Angomonas deanei]|nr:hypothetical protein AGDE_08048 [Angomonas deanei]|eukprot:EPY34044.1 hypothetical protein AGDE_08048 [Angomonas deanei]